MSLSSELQMSQLEQSSYAGRWRLTAPSRATGQRESR